MISYAFVLLMMAIGGVIGYLADSWGHKIGKKRLSFLSLRPRHTATLVTVGAGVLIPLVTVVIVGFLSSGVRAWLLYGQEAIRKSQELQSAVDDLQKTSRGLNREIEKKTQEQKRLDDLLTSTKTQLAESKAKAEKYMAEAAAAASKANLLTVKVQQISEQLSGVREDLRKSTADLAERQTALRKAKLEFLEANNQREELSKKNLELQADIRTLENDLKRLKSDIETLKSEKKLTDDALTDSKEQLATTEQRLKTLSDELVETSNQLADSAVRLDKLRTDYDKLEADQKILRGLTGQSRFNPMIFSFRDELSRVQIPPNRSTAEAELLLESLLRSARIEAEKRGAVGTSKYPAAGLAEIEDANGRKTSVEERKAQIVKALTGKDQNYVLIACTLYNAFKEEWIPLNVVGYPNPIVYRSGQFIADTDIDGRLPEKDVIDAIGAFIRTRVTSQAIADKMIPIRGREDALGTVPTDDVLALVKKLRESGRRAKVRAEAAQDTRAADTLKLKLSVL